MSQLAGASKRRVDTAELRVALENVLGRRLGTRHRIAKLERWPSIYSTSYAIDELDVRLDNGTGLRLLFKDLSREAMLWPARLVKPAFLYEPLREIETYRTILEPNQVGAATFYGAFVDPPARNYGLFLEKVPGVE